MRKLFPDSTRSTRFPVAGAAPGFLFGAAAILLFFLLLLPAAPALGDPDSCTTCHSDPRFLVQNKKLYDYFRDWELSVHSQEGVTCVNCHGGNPNAKDKKAAHAGKPLKAAQQASPINYRNIPGTCAKCHRNIYDEYRKSLHFAHLQGRNGEPQGPNCVTCHGSVSTSVLNVNSVRKACSQCHNERKGIAPEIPGRAERVLNTLLSIHRYYRYITIRGDPEDAQAFFRLVDPLIEKLNVEWHSFDIERITRRTKDVLKLMKVKRNDIKAASR